MSAGQGRDIDPEMIKAGGPEFAQRLAQYKAAKDGAEKAQADLRLGQDAAIAYAAAQRVLGEATATAAQMIDEARAKSQAMIAQAEAMLTHAENAKRDAKAVVKELAAELQAFGKDAGLV
jgi:hypothetical protein